MRCYTSVYGPFIARFVVFKRSLGYKFVHGESVLGRFDAFCAKRGEGSIGITRELSEEWGRKRDNESDPTRYARVHYLIQFASYLNDMGYPSFVPRPPSKYRSTFTPHIFSHEELGSLFPAIDEVCVNARRICTSCADAFPTMARFLYGTGARIGEAVALRESDVNLERGIATLRFTKNGQERMVPMSASLSDAMRQYAASSGGAGLGEPFFKRADGEPCTCNTAYEWFRRGLSRAGIPHLGGGKGPRLHDLRHTFAVHSLAKMADEGLDLYYSLPILSAYLGHQSLEATDTYVRLTAEMFPFVIDSSDKVCSYVFPEVNPWR